VSKVDADIAALKSLEAALSRYASAQLDVLARARDRAERALAAAAERRAAVDEPADPVRYDRALRWLWRVDEQITEYLVAAERFRELLESGLPRAQATLGTVIARLEAVRRT
jgi:hypothetical protein